MRTSHATQIHSNTKSPVLYMAIELATNKWKDGFSTGIGRARIRTMKPEAIAQEIGKAMRRFDLPKDAQVICCHEAGRDGFWVHRNLLRMGVTSLVVDSASIDVNRRLRRAKTDRLDAQKLLNKLVHYHLGDVRVWSVVRVPTIEGEDAKRPHREIGRLNKERTAHRNRIWALLALQGCRPDNLGTALKDLDDLRGKGGLAIPPNLKKEIRREQVRLNLAEAQIKEIKAEQRKEFRANKESRPMKIISTLASLKGIGFDGAWLLSMEFFACRSFKSRQEVGGASGLTPTPYNTGASAREQGISKAGNPRVRGLIIELAWKWLRWQPDSDLSKWFEAKFGHGSKRMRKVGIVALARKLLIALWRFAETGKIPQGAILGNPAK